MNSATRHADYFICATSDVLDWVPKTFEADITVFRTPDSQDGSHVQERFTPFIVFLFRRAPSGDHLDSLRIYRLCHVSGDHSKRQEWYGSEVGDWLEIVDNGYLASLRYLSLRKA